MNNNYEAIKNLPISISIELGRKKISIKELLEVKYHSILELDTKANEPLKMYVNGKLFGLCKVVVKNEDKSVQPKLCIQILEIFNKKENHGS